MIRTARMLGWIAVLAVAGACGGPPPTDTGFVGSWERQGGRASSTISIREENGSYVFRWSLQDGPRRVRCDRAGICGEWDGTMKTYRYEFRTRLEEGGQALLVERIGTPIVENLTPLTLLDRLTVEPGGLALRSRTLEINQESVGNGEGGPSYYYRKLADEPF